MGKKRKPAGIDQYTGKTDSEGRYHGRGTLRSEGAVYEGRFEQGERHGLGKLTVKESDESWMIMQGRWANDELVYAADITSSDGTTIRGPIQEGIVKELTDGALRFEGHYKDGLRDGIGTVYHVGGGETDGIWKAGEMVETTVHRYPCRFGITLKDFELHDDVSDAKRISREPLRADPYETKRVYVAKSELGGEGLFAAVALKPGELVSFYNGTRLPVTQADARSWRLNNNAIHVWGNEAIDVAAPYDQTKKYCGSLSHKANHSHKHPNCEFALCDHPRFGMIKSIRVKEKSIKKGTEILCDYGFDGSHGYPKWWVP